jgi:hypothetical protein
VSQLTPTLYDTIEYSVCEDCVQFLANDEVPDGKAHDFYFEAVSHQLGGRTGHFSMGIDPTEDDPEGAGYDEFSWHECELCRSSLGGSRHGVTLFVEVP